MKPKKNKKREKTIFSFTYFIFIGRERAVLQECAYCTHSVHLLGRHLVRPISARAPRPSIQPADSAAAALLKM